MSKPDKRAQIEFRAVSSLRGYERNARTHSPEQVAQLAASIREFGFTNPVLVTPDGVIVAGHGRVAAAQEIGLVDVPTLVVGADWPPEKVRAYVLADNKLALNAGWDNEILRAELDELRGVDFDISLTGFSEVELARLLSDAVPDGEAANDPGAEWRGMPEFKHEDKTAFRTMPVHFKDQDAVDAFAKLIGQKITEKTRFVHFPETEIERYADKRYAAE